MQPNYSSLPVTFPQSYKTYPATQPKASSPSIKNCNVAVVVSRPETSTFWMNIIHHQAIALASHEINMMYVYLPPTYSDDFTLPNCLTDGSVSGIIVMNIYDPRLFLALNNLELPKVFLDCPTNTSFSSLNGDLFLIEGRANTEEIVGGTECLHGLVIDFPVLRGCYCVFWVIMICIGSACV